MRNFFNKVLNEMLTIFNQFVFPSFKTIFDGQQYTIHIHLLYLSILPSLMCIYLLRLGIH